MKPTLINIGGRCYRKMPFEQKIEHREPPEQRSSHHDEEALAWDDEACDAFGLVEKTAAGYRLCMEVPSLLYRFIIGKKGDTKRKIEKQTGTQIMIPRQGEEGDIGESIF